MRTTYRECRVCQKGFQAAYEYTDGDEPGMMLIDTVCAACMQLLEDNEPDLYVKVHLIGGGTYVQKLHQLGVIIEEIQTAAACNDVGCRWEIELVEMTRKEYLALGEFEGH